MFHSINAKDKELGFSLHAGLMHDINQNLYIGIKGTYTRVNGPTDELGIEYEAMKTASVMATVGYRF